MSAEQVVTFESVVPEEELKGFSLNFRPDAIACRKSIDLAVEFRVWHKVDDDKRAKIARQNLSALEIDLSQPGPALSSAEALDDFILHRAPRHWIHNRHLAAETERLKKRQAAEAKRLREQQVAEARRRLGLVQQRLAQRPWITPPQGWVADLLGSVEEAGLTPLLKEKARFDHWFTVRPQLWKAAVLVKFVIKPAELYAPGRELEIKPSWSASGFVSALESWLVRDDLGDLIKPNARKPNHYQYLVGTANAAIEDYLNAVSCCGTAIESDESRYLIAVDLHRHLHQIGSYRSKVYRLLELAQFPGDKQQAWRSWRDRRLESGFSPAQLAAIHADQSGALERHLHRLIHMADDWFEGALETDFLGLPLQPLYDRCAERITALQRNRAEQEAKAARDRQENFQREASRLLQEEAEAWLTHPNASGSTSPRSLAASSDEGLQQAMSDLRAASNQRKIRLDLERIRTEAMAALRADAAKAFPDKRFAGLFLRSPHPSLGGAKPIEYVDGPRTLDQVRLLLKRTR